MSRFSPGQGLLLFGVATLLAALLLRIRRPAPALAREIEELRELVSERESELARIEKARADLASELREAQAQSRSRSVFLADLFSELQTELNGVLGITHLMLDTELDEHRSEVVMDIQRTCESLLGTLGDLCDFSKLETGRVRIDAEPFRLHTLVKATLARFVFAAHHKGLTLSCDIDEEVPATALGDKRRLGQVLSHLLDNAIKYTRDGRIVVRVTRKPHAGTGHRVKLAVIDTGAGIPARSPEDPFGFEARKRSSGDRHAWAGLGLAICRDLAHMMGGKVGFESEEGRGSTFWFTVTLGFAPPIVPSERTDPGKTVLLVASNPDITASIFVALQRQGISVQIEEDRMHFRDALESRHYGLVLLDCEESEHIATLASWSRIGQVQKVPVIGVPRRPDARELVDFERLLPAVRRHLGGLEVEAGLRAEVPSE